MPRDFELGRNGTVVKISPSVSYGANLLRLAEATSLMKENIVKADCSYLPCSLISAMYRYRGVVRLDSVVDSSAVYINHLLPYLHSSLLSLTYLLICKNRPVPFPGRTS